MINQYAQSNTPKRRPRRVVIVVAVIAAAMLGGVLGYLPALYFGLKAHDDFLTRLNDAQELNEKEAVERFKTDKQIKLIFNKIHYELSSFDYNANLAAINEFENLTEKNYGRKVQLCDDADGSMMRSKHFPDSKKLRVLNNKTREDVELIRRTTQTLEQDGMCAHNEGEYNYDQWLIDLNKGESAIFKLYQTLGVDKDAREVLSKFARHTYDVKGMDQIKKARVNEYEVLIKAHITRFAAAYDFFIEDDNNQVALRSKYDTYVQKSKEASDAQTKADAAYKKKQISDYKGDVELETILYKAAKRLNTEPTKTHYEPALWTNGVIDIALVSYGLDHDGVYPQASTAAELSQKLIAGKYLTDKDLFQNIQYRSITGYGYLLISKLNSGKKYVTERYVNRDTYGPKEPELIEDVNSTNKAGDLPLPRSVEFINDVPGKPLAIKINAAKLTSEPNSQVTVYIDSPVVKLGTLNVAKDGSFSGEITLPKDSASSIRMIHILCKSFSGEPLDLYQPMMILPNGSIYF
jgi:hypothetical protein